jgi:hypothetical protein
LFDFKNDVQDICQAAQQQTKILGKLKEIETT